MQNTRKLITEDKVDVVVGSVTTPVAVAMADVCAEGKTPQLMLSPANLPPGKDGWSFRMPQSTAVMAIPIVEQWKKLGVKTYGFLGYSDGYGEAWLTDIKPLAEKAGIKLVDTERFARSDTAVTGQALKLVQPTPTRSSSSPRAAARRCRTRAWSSAATRRARSTRPTARRRWT